jgi:hypothetical protein
MRPCHLRFAFWVASVNDFLIFLQYDSLDHISRFSIGRIDKLSVGAVSLWFGRK